MNEKRYADLVADFKKLFSFVGGLNDPFLRSGLMSYLAQWLATATDAEGIPKDSFKRDVADAMSAESASESLTPLHSDLLKVARLRCPGASDALERAFIESAELREAAIRYLVAETLYLDGSASEFYREKRKQTFLDGFAITCARSFQYKNAIVYAIQSLARQIADARLSASVKGELNAD